MEKITYIVPGLMDWMAQIRVGGAIARVHFTGGALTAYGVTPAEFTTTNEFMQKAIEQSDYFKQKRIQIGRRVNVGKAPASSIQAAKKVGEKTKGLEDSSDLVAREEKKDVVVKEVEVACLQDAQNYLKENFGVVSRKVASEEKADAIGKEYGVKFLWKS